MAFEDERPRVQIGNVLFKYTQPNVSVNTSARYVEHDVIGDTVVRQKIGESPDEISVEGVCTAGEASMIDDLVHETEVTFISNRWEGVAQVASTSTSPLDDGGALDPDGEWTHEFTAELVGVEEQTELIPYEMLLGMTF